MKTKAFVAEVKRKMSSITTCQAVNVSMDRSSKMLTDGSQTHTPEEIPSASISDKASADDVIASTNPSMLASSMAGNAVYLASKVRCVSLVNTIETTRNREVQILETVLLSKPEEPSMQEPSTVRPSAALFQYPSDGFDSVGSAICSSSTIATGQKLKKTVRSSSEQRQ